MAKKTVNLADGTADQDAATYGQLRKHQDLKVVQSMAGLPSPTDPDPTKRPITGHSYLVLKDPFGQPLNRLLTWNGAQDTTAGVLEVDVIEPAADKAVITAQAGTADGGVQFDITGGTGAGALLTLTANADGSISGTIDTPGTGYRVGDRVKTEFVRFSVNVPLLHSATGQPHREASVVMIAAVVAALHHGSAAKFAAPDDQGVLE